MQRAIHKPRPLVQALSVFLTASLVGCAASPAQHFAASGGADSSASNVETQTRGDFLSSALAVMAAIGGGNPNEAKSTSMAATGSDHITRRKP
jgi:hypothetical protein